MRKFGASVIDAGAKLQSAVDEVESSDARRRAKEFAWEEKLALEEQMRQMQPGQAGGFHDRWVEGYKERAADFLETVPSKYKVDIDSALFETEKSLFSEAATFARNEQKRFSLAGIDQYKSRLALSSDLDAARSSFSSYVDDNPWLTPIDKDKTKRKGLADLEEINVDHRLRAKEKYDDILKDIREGTERPDTLTARPGESVEGYFRAEGLDVELGVDPTAPYMARPRDESKISRIIVHGDVSEDAEALVEYGRRVDPQRGFDPNYHFYIGRDGRIIQGVPLNRSANHTKGENSDSIGIVIAGADAGKMPTPEQEAAAKRLISSLGKTYGIDPQNVMGHGELQPGRRDKREGGNVAADIRKNGFAPDDVNEVTEVRVAEAEGETATDAERTPRARLPGPPRYQHLSAEKRLQLANKVLQKQEAERKRTLAEIGKAEDLAAEGLPPDQELVGKIMDGIDRAGGEEVIKAWEEVSDTWKWTTTLREGTPQEIEQAVIKLRRRLESGGASKTDARRLKVGETLLDNMRSELKSNPLGWAARVGKIDLQELDFSDLNAAAASFEERILQAEDVAGFYGLEKPVYLTPDEAKRIAGAMEQGPDAMLSTAALIANAGKRRATAIFGEVAKHAPDAAFLGDLVVRTGLDNQVARDAAEGLALMKQPHFEKMSPSPKIAREVAVGAIETALMALPKTEQTAITVANAAYEMRARRMGVAEFDDELWERTFLEALGQREIDGEMYGGVAYHGGGFLGFGGQPVIVPPNVKQDGFSDLIGALKPSDLMDPFGNVPSTFDGRPISMAAIQRAKLLTVGPGRYWVALGDLEEDPQFILSGGKPFVLDLNALEDTLRKRRPDLYFGE